MTFQYSQQIDLHHLGTTRCKLGDWIRNLKRTKFCTWKYTERNIRWILYGYSESPKKSICFYKKAISRGMCMILSLTFDASSPGLRHATPNKIRDGTFWGKLNQKSQGQLRHALHGSEIHRKGPAKRMSCVFCP